MVQYVQAIEGARAVSRILGIEFRGSQATLTCVTRRGHVEYALSEPLATHAAHWWLVHPEERFRTFAGLVDRARGEGGLGGGEIAAVGLCADPGLVFLDRDLAVIPPRSLPRPVPEHEADAPAHLRAALAAVIAHDARFREQLGAVLSTVDFLRYRLTGALASHASFAWVAGLAGALAPLVWNMSAAREIGLSPAVLPPLFTAECRVGTISDEMMRRLGIPRGVWVNAGSDPLSARFLVAAEPRAGSKLAWLGDGSGGAAGGDDAALAPPQRWSVVANPTSAAALPTPLPGIWFEPETQALGAGSEDVIDAAADDAIERWIGRHGAAGIAFDAGGASAGAAIQAGLGAGWWKDLRALWRKHRAPLDVAEWRARRGISHPCSPGAHGAS
ncbi:MAG: hypothetical protein L0Z55_05585 [Planctomycetes bacterium]|nr:hypothetical protein [Planctomycetota bacterium]